jgi:hypothetical protein
MITQLYQDRNDACNVWKFYSPMYDGFFYVAVLYHKFDAGIRQACEFFEPAELREYAQDYFAVRKDSLIPFYGFEIRPQQSVSEFALRAEILPQKVTDAELKQMFDLNKYLVKDYALLESVTQDFASMMHKRPTNVLSFQRRDV